MNWIDIDRFLFESIKRDEKNFIDNTMKHFGWTERQTKQNVAHIYETLNQLSPEIEEITIRR